MNPGINAKDLNSLLFGGAAPMTAPPSSNQIVDLPLSKIYDKRNHTFKGYREGWTDFVESIRMNGVQEPILVRYKPCELGDYECVAGHQRREGAAKAGYTTIPAIIKEMDDIDANISMVITNLHRPNWRPSECARSWKVLYESFKAQGHRSDLLESDGPSAEERMEQITGKNIRTVQRTIKLCDLTDNLLTLIDDKKLPVSVGEKLSFLSVENQNIVEQLICEFGIPSNSDAEFFKMMQEKGNLSYTILAGYMNSKEVQPAPFKLTEKEIRDWFPSTYTGTETDKKNLIKKLLADYFESKEHESTEIC